jgi:hypothetical protein
MIIWNEFESDIGLKSSCPGMKQWFLVRLLIPEKSFTHVSCERFNSKYSEGRALPSYNRRRYIKEIENK